ncbi:MAG: prepilin-type N-terminal cleavage/methylation domain-containing protein [Eubacteriales bacterium]|nr:prepilin-type N-terminal cleavage/methylation domain-containing protein [Eubacteriales bacterium]
MKKRTKKGFTLIELIVVIAILAILAIIAIPVISGVVDDANQAAADANVRTIELAAKAYMTENDVALSSSNWEDALEEFGLIDPTDLTKSIGGKGTYTVDKDGNAKATDIKGGSGAITFDSGS